MSRLSEQKRPEFEFTLCIGKHKIVVYQCLKMIQELGKKLMGHVLDAIIIAANVKSNKDSFVLFYIS